MNENKILVPHDCLNRKRLTHEQPTAIAELGWRYHHIGIPYLKSKFGEKYHENLKMAAFGFDTSPYGVEWFRLENDCPVNVPEIVRMVPHIAFEVDDLDAELKGKEILIQPHRLIDEVRIAMFLHNGSPIELMDFDDKSKIEFIKRNYMNENKILASSDCLTRKRLKHEPPAAIAELGWRYHHLGIPYYQPKQGEKYYEHLKIAVLGFETSPYGIEWVRFEKDCKVPDIVRNVPHLAFEVNNLDEALKGKEVLIEPGTPSGGVRVAFIMNDGAPIELMEFDNNKI